MAEDPRVRTGVPGLDALLGGGLPERNVVLVAGPSGSGKTVLGLQFVVGGIVHDNEPGMVVTFENPPAKLTRDAAGFGWDLEELQRRNLLKIVFTSPQVLCQELRDPDSILLETAIQSGTRRIFIDNVSLLRNLVELNDSTFRRVLHRLIDGLQSSDLSAMLAHEIDTCADHCPLGEAEFLADTVFLLRREGHRSGMRRTLEVTKSRGQDYQTGKHTLLISDGRGVEVFCRVQARSRTFDSPAVGQPSALPVGCDAIDVLIPDGLFKGSSTMVVGSPGTGKTVLAVQLLAEGAARLHERGMLISFDETADQIARNAAGLGFDLAPALAAGTVHLFEDSPRELEVDMHFDRITRLVEERGIQRLVIDGLSSFSEALRDPGAYRDFMHALLDFCRARRVTCFLNYEHPELFTVSRVMPDFSIASLVDNIILLSFVELGCRLRRAVTVLKARGRSHDLMPREFAIGPGGIHLVHLDGYRAPPMLPFQCYAGLLSRAPAPFVSFLGQTDYAQTREEVQS